MVNKKPIILHNSQTNAPIQKKLVYPPPPFPQRLQEQKHEKQFQEFMDVFKNLSINILFIKALEQMPSYVKFMKDIFSRKRRLKDFEIVALTDECNAILQKKLPPKLKDPGSFTIPCTIGTQYFGKALCDLGANINLMTLSIFMKLGVGEVKPTSVRLQLADRSLAYPRGIVKDILVKVDKFIFPADFIVLDMEEDLAIPLLLGRPFLATGRTLIDVQKGELTMRVQDDQVTFNVFSAMKFSNNEESCFSLNVITELSLQEAGDESFEEITECIMELNALLTYRRSFHNFESFKMPDKSKTSKPSIEEPPELELKQLPEHLKYVFLGDNATFP
ncbi:uncharacterized protein LOC141696296 [Apium graveolens]|uniref:uncharacterized protein LOC141696296 n=1 Tax=Apium graveolens TaxID=4045 RepID=UPI003D79994E